MLHLELELERLTWVKESDNGYGKTQWALGRSRQC
jgi:hypothetical protein